MNMEVFLGLTNMRVIITESVHLNHTQKMEQKRS